MLVGLNELRKTDTFCDAVIVVDEVLFPVHKVVLSATSNFFKALFTCDMVESKLKHVPLNGLSADIARLLIDYCYTSEITLNQDNVQRVLSASNLLEILPVKEAASKYLDRHMDPSNCLGIHRFAELHSCHALHMKAKSFTLKHFSQVRFFIY